MNLDSLTFSLSRIHYLVINLSKKNFKQTSQELSQIVNHYGLEAENQLLRSLLTEAAKTSWDTDRTGPAVNSIHASLLAQYLGSLLSHPAKSTVVCRAVDSPNRSVQKILKPSNTLLNRLSRLLKLTTAEDVTLSLVLRRYSSKTEIAAFAKQHLKKRFLDLVQCYLDAEHGHQAERAGLQECSPEVLQTLLINLAYENFRLAPVTKELFVKRLRVDFPREVVPIVLAPLLYPDDTQTPLEEMSTADDMAVAMMDNSLAEIIRDMGYGFTASFEECKNSMLNFGAREPTAIDIARIISMMVRYHTTMPDGPPIQTPGNFWTNHEAKKEGITHGHGETWNAEIFVQTLKELASNLNWKEVILQLDHPEFIVPDRQGLSLLFSILRLGLQSAGYPSNIFPVEYLCRRWTNLEGQMSLITNILKHPDIFSLADYPFHPVSIDILKSLPETDNKEIATWRCLYLVELLLYASERGYYMQVHELFKFPLQHCPDVLMLALLQINAPITVFQQELLSTLIPIFLGNHPNSGIILQHAWHSQNPNIKPIIMHAMAEWYIRGDSDQSKLSRILDVAQDLKALSLLLNVQSFPFVIDLACLASRREYLKLDKWLTDKIRDHGESFVSAMVKFLQRRCPPVMGKPAEEQLPKAAQLPPETIGTMLTCLQLCAPNVVQELQEAIYNVVATCQALIINKTRQTMAGIARPHTRVIETPFNPAALGGQLFTPHVDSIANLTPNVANMTLGAPVNTAFAMPGTLGPLVPPPGSPSRLLGPGPNSPYPMMAIPHNPNIPNMGALRMAQMPPMDKFRLPDQIHFPELMHNVSKEIEDEANGYFQRIYNHPPHPTLSIDEVLEMLKKFQDSPNKREREVFSCMLRNLFEEYKFFPQYPDKELHITAQLFGGIIEKGLVPTYVSLGLALRFVLDALRKPEGSKMYYFGIAALDRFKSRLKDYHKYCEHVRAIPHFSEFPPHLIEYIEYGLQSQEPPTKPQGPVLPATLAAMLNQNTVVTVSAPYRTVVGAPTPMSVISKVANCVAGGIGSRPSIAIATNIDTLLTATDREEKINAPPEAIQDKTAFIFNNLSQLNLQTKCEELKEILTEEYYPWLSQYLVMKRASIEFNFHALYSNFLDVLKAREVNRLVIIETYRNIKVLLRSDKSIANFSDRSLLKNLGHWLGMLTLARNQPILLVDIDLKALLLEAYHKGQQELLYVVPFVAKVLESTARSLAFKPPNPWTMGLMNVLAELHQEPDLKLNLKFEIEVLCKNLSIDISELKPTLYLKDPEKHRLIEFQLSQPKVNKEPVAVVPINQAIVQAPQMQMMPPQPTMIPIEEMTLSVPPPPLGMCPDPTLMGILGMPEPRFNYLDVNVTSTSAFGQKICFNHHILLFQNYPHLKQFVKPAIERSIQEWIHPVVDRSIKYALTTCEQIIRKDFALDPDEGRMRTCAHHMMRNLTAGMAMITCREQIVSTISTNLKAAFLTALIPANPQQKDIVESAAAVLATENMELACAFIQKTAVEKALPELDKRLMNDYEIRKQARIENRRYYDPIVLTYQTENLPERVRLRMGGPMDMQISVYEEFACNIPGFMPLRDAGMFIPKPSQEQIPQLTFSQVINPTQVYGADEMGGLISAAEMFLSSVLNTQSFPVQATNMHTLLECLVIARRNRDIVSGCNLLQRAVEGLLDGHIIQSGVNAEHVDLMTRYRDIHLRVLKLLEDARVYGHVWTTKQITCCLTECRDELRYNIEAVDCLIRNHLINMPQYDLALAHLMDNGNNYVAVAFAMQLVQLYLVDDRNNIFVNESDLYHTTETLVRMMAHPQQPPPEGLATLIETLRINQDPSAYLGERMPLGPTAHIHSGILQVRNREYDDPPGLQEKTDNVLHEWRTLLQSPLTDVEFSQNFNIYVHRMNMNGILKSDDMITRFFRIATQMCIQNVYQQLNEERANPPPVPPKREKYYVMCDSFIKLVTLLIKNTADAGNPTPKLNLLNKILGIIAGCLLQDHEEPGNNFQQLPYHRLLLILFLDMNMAEPVLESMNYQVLTAFCHTLRIIRPSVAPGFCYAWLEFLSHRSFINRVLAVTPQQKGWGMYSTLLIDLFKFLDPFLRNTELGAPVMALYKGTLKVLLVLLHDFPEFLCDYHFGFCDEIPPNCIQMRNLILSAFPRNMRLPDPFTPNLKVDLLAEIALSPRAVINYATIIPITQFKKDLDAYLKARTPVTFLSELRSNMQFPQVGSEPARRYNTQLLNAVVLYVGAQAIAYIRSKGQTPNMTTIAHSSHMDIFQNFTVDFDYEGRYLFFNAIANQLRYPNSHTHYFSCCLLYLFAEANSEAIQEQITRMLLERLIVNRPHPWGLLITFIELIKNPVYKFWSHEFVHCAPEIEKLAKRRNATSEHQPALHLVRSAQAVEPTVQEVNPLNFNVGVDQQTTVNSHTK